MLIWIIQNQFFFDFYKEEDAYEGDGDDIYIENNNNKENEFFKEEENNEEEFEENEYINSKNKSNYIQKNNKNNKNYYKINNKINNKKINNKNQNKKKSIEIALLPKKIKSAKTEMKKDKNKKLHQKKSPLKMNLNENLTPNKYLKRVKSLTNGSNTNSNINISKNFVTLRNSNKEASNNYSNIDNNNLNLLNSTNDKTILNNKKIPNSTTYNYYIKNLPDIQMNNNKYQTYEERMSDNLNNINSFFSGNEFNSKSFNSTKNFLTKNNFRNNFEENQHILDISDNKNTNVNKRINKTLENLNINTNYYNNRNHLSKIDYNKTNPSFISNNHQSNNISIYSQQNQNDNQNNENEYEENYIDEEKNYLERKKDKIKNNSNNSNTNNSQRFSMMSNHENVQSAKINRNKILKEKLDYLEGNIIEIKKELNILSENVSFLSSKEFLFDNFKDQIIQICEEIFNENYINDKNNSLISNSNYWNKNKIRLENQINKKIDEKFGNLQNNLYNKFIVPTINEIGNSMKKNIELIKNRVDTIGNSIYSQKNNNDKNGNFIQNNEDEDEIEYKSSSKLRNEKFDEINRIGEKLYNNLLEKEKK